MSRPFCPAPQLGRDVDVQMKMPGEASSVCQLAMKSESWNGSDSSLSFSPRTVE